MKLSRLTPILTTLLPIILWTLLTSGIAHGANFGNLEIPLPGLNKSIDTIASNGLLSYVDVIIRFVTVGIILVGIIAVVVSGFMYITAGGDDSQVKSAKTISQSALLGIVLALAAYTILNTIGTQFASELKQPCIPNAPDSCGLGVMCPADGRCP